MLDTKTAERGKKRMIFWWRLFCKPTGHPSLLGTPPVVAYRPISVNVHVALGQEERVYQR